MRGWEAGLDDEEACAVMRTVTRQLKLWLREAAGLGGKIAAMRKDWRRSGTRRRYGI